MESENSCSSHSGQQPLRQWCDLCKRFFCKDCPHTRYRTHKDHCKDAQEYLRAFRSLAKTKSYVLSQKAAACSALLSEDPAVSRLEPAVGIIQGFGKVKSDAGKLQGKIKQSQTFVRAFLSKYSEEGRFSDPAELSPECMLVAERLITGDNEELTTLGREKAELSLRLESVLGSFTNIPKPADKQEQRTMFDCGVRLGEENVQMAMQLSRQARKLKEMAETRERLRAKILRLERRENELIERNADEEKKLRETTEKLKHENEVLDQSVNSLTEDKAKLEQTIKDTEKAARDRIVALVNNVREKYAGWVATTNRLNERIGGLLEKMEGGGLYTKAANAIKELTRKLGKLHNDIKTEEKKRQLIRNDIISETQKLDAIISEITQATEKKANLTQKNKELREARTSLKCTVKSLRKVQSDYERQALWSGRLEDMKKAMS